MNILGYSGLHGSIEFRRFNYPNLTEQEYRMCQGLDSAACIFVNGRNIAAAEEERFNGEKYTCNFPINSINYCLKSAGLSINDIDYICHSFDYYKYKEIYGLNNEAYYTEVLSAEAQIKLWQLHFPGINLAKKFINIDHHLAHAATAYYPSGFDSALVLIADGIGEAYSISIFSADGNELKLHKNYNLYSSLGILYSQITAHLGFEVNSDEYKVMGLAPYGDSTKYQKFFDDMIELRSDGSIYIKAFNLNTTELDRQTGRAFRQWISEHIFPQREKSAPIMQIHKDFASSLQRALEKCFLHILSYWQKQTSEKNLCMAGGVALNCTANGVILKHNIFENMYIQPAACDAGTAMGAAMIQSQRSGDILEIPPHQLPFFGPEFSDAEYLAAINKYGDTINVEYFPDDTIITEAAKWLADQKIIGWMQGRMEFGPRALGNRSILADPRDPTMRDRINQKVKKREGFRPFAPSAKLEKAHIYFDVPVMQEFPHMLYTVPVRDEHRDGLPAITHIDGSARLQTVNKAHAEKYWLLIDRFEQITGIPIVLNTSFNVKGQPIVCTPEEAIDTLIYAELDALFIGNYLVRKK